ELTDSQAAIVKAFCTSKARETVSWARESIGGNGVLVDYNVARHFADAEAIYAYEGTYQMQTLIVGKAITGLSAFGFTSPAKPSPLGFRVAMGLGTEVHERQK